MEPEVFNAEEFGTSLATVSTQHPWSASLQSRFSLHPSVKLMLERYAPRSYHQLALEFPYVSERDATRLAYTRSISDGINDRQLITSIGKYLARHFAHIEDHNRRDVQASYTPDTLVIRSTTPEIIQGIEEGPRSCMASVYNSIPFKAYHKEQMQEWFKDPTTQTEPDWSLHPYSAYKPEFGWSIALRVTTAGAIDGRALIYKHEDQLLFLRTYRRHPTNPEGWSESDFTLQEWLKYQGYTKVSAWPEGAKLHTPRAENGCLFAPYIDGGANGVTFDGDTTSEITYRDYDYKCEQTSANVCEIGSAKSGGGDEGDEEYCEYCDSHRNPGYMCYAGRNENTYLCVDCRDNDFTEVLALSRHGRTIEYYIPNDAAEQVSGTATYIDPEYPPEDVVQLENGDWAEIDNCVSIDGDYYLTDDRHVVELQDNEDLDDSYGLKDDCYEVDGKWWKDEDHYLEFHPCDSEGEVEDLTTTVAAVSDERFALVA